MGVPDLSSGWLSRQTPPTLSFTRHASRRASRMLRLRSYRSPTWLRTRSPPPTMERFGVTLDINLPYRCLSFEGFYGIVVSNVFQIKKYLPV